jgi:hypothetical protein
LVEQPSQTRVNRRRPSLGRSLGLPPLASYMAIKADSSALLAEVAGAIPQAVPEAPRPHERADDSSERD